MKILLILIGFWATSSAAMAQTTCDSPVVKVLCNGEEIPAAGSPMAPFVRLQITPNVQCEEKISYRSKGAEITLLRGGRPITPTLLLQKPQADLRGLVPMARPGDRIYVFIPYQNLSVVAADGTQQPYLASKPKKPSKGIDIQTENSKGISFSWLLLP